MLRPRRKTVAIIVPTRVPMSRQRIRVCRCPSTATTAVITDLVKTITRIIGLTASRLAPALALSPSLSRLRTRPLIIAITLLVSTTGRTVLARIAVLSVLLRSVSAALALVARNVIAARSRAIIVRNALTRALRPALALAARPHRLLPLAAPAHLRPAPAARLVLARPHLVAPAARLVLAALAHPLLAR